ncbi:SDR family NAD(P)-dependent oxidoreductase [Luteimonas sp. A277]
MTATASSASAPVEAAPLAGRVVLVVGAHGGLGREASLACAAAGARLVLLGRKVPRLNRVHDAIAKSGGEAALYPLDLEGAGPDDYAEMAGRIEEAFGQLDGVLHCAADFPGLTPLEHTDPAAFARAIHVNLTARWWLTQACLPLLRRSEDGAVVFAIDDPARTSQAYWGGYGIAQGGLEVLVPMLHSELASTTVRVCGLRPGPMRTPLRAQAYMDREGPEAADPAAYAQACVNLLSAAGNAHRGRIWGGAGSSL